MTGSGNPQDGKSNANTLAYISFFVAALSLATSMYQGYLNTRFVEIVQSNVARGETARICKDLIDGYFQIKFRTSALAVAVQREKDPSSPAIVAASSEAQHAASRFAAYGTYLANFLGEQKRIEYTALSNELARVVGEVQRPAATDVSALFEKADALFAAMNADCVKNAATRF